MEDQQIEELYAKLSYPTAAKFRAALEKRGIKLSAKAVQEFVSKYGQRQVLRPSGHMPAES